MVTNPGVPGDGGINPDGHYDGGGSGGSGGSDPVPYPDIGGGEDSTGDGKEVTIEGSESMHTPSSGDEPGTSGGVVSSSPGTDVGYAPMWSMNVKVEGKGVTRFSDLGMDQGGQADPGDAKDDEKNETEEQEEESSSIFKMDPYEGPDDPFGMGGDGSASTLDDIAEDELSLEAFKDSFEAEDEMWD